MTIRYKDYYAILGVARGASQDTIRGAYRGLTKKYHPDVSEDKNADARYREINEAYEVLRDPEKRPRYDALDTNWQAQDFTPPPRQDESTESSESNAVGGNDTEDFSDFFKTVFSDFFANTGNPKGRSVRRDGEVELELSLEELVKGRTHSFVLSTEEQGKEEWKINVKLPRGVSEGSSIRLPGKAPGGGDLYVILHIAPHSVFQVEGYDLVRTLKIPVWQAVLGGTISILTLDGSSEVQLLPGTQNEHKVKLKGKGLPKRGSQENGDLFVCIQVVIPTHVTPSQKKLWEELSRS